MTKEVLIYTTASCPYCVRAKALLDAEKIVYKEIRVDLEAKLREEMMRISGRRTVPQIFIGERHVGGFDDLKVLYESNALNTWLIE